MKRILIIIYNNRSPAAVSCLRRQNDGEAAAQTVEAYLSALVEQDTDTLVNLSCAAWEQGALTDSAAYDGVTARLEGTPSAPPPAQEGDSMLVSCQRQQSSPPTPAKTARCRSTACTYLTVNEGGEWRMCGYK